MAARSKARKRAVDILFESTLRATDPIATLAERLAQADPPVGPYAVELVEGVVCHQAEIDELIDRHAAADWAPERIPPVDRAVLRVAVYELCWRDDIPDAVAIDEAVELAKALSTDASPAFVNGLLSTVRAGAGAAPSTTMIESHPPAGKPTAT